VLAERIRASIEREQFIVGDKIVPITVSIGIASFGVDPGRYRSAAGSADNAFTGQESGRNRICVNDEGKTTFA